MKFIHTADIHLGARPDLQMPWAQNRSKELWKNFENLLKMAYEQKVDFVFIAGDLFHRKPLLSELRELNYLFEQIQPVRIVFMAGNHDYIDEDRLYQKIDWAKNVSVFTSQDVNCLYFEEEQTYVYGLSYEHYEIEEPLYDRLKPVKRPGCHILLAHGGDAKHVPMDMNRLIRAGFDYIAMGHIHLPQMMYDGKAAYAGALHPIEKGDYGKHGYVFGSFDGHHLETCFIALEQREYKTIEIEMNGSMTWRSVLGMIQSEIESLGKMHMYSIRLTGFRHPEIEMDLDELMMLGRIVDVEDLTRMDYDIQLLYAQNKDNLIGMYIDKVKTMPISEDIKNRALDYGLKALLKSK